LPAAAIGILKPVAWAASNRSIQPVAIPLTELAVNTDAQGVRRVSIPSAYGGGTLVERPGAIQGRANDATPREQLASLKSMFSSPRWRR
jgi:hypothetical protein